MRDKKTAAQPAMITSKTFAEIPRGFVYYRRHFSWNEHHIRYEIDWTLPGDNIKNFSDDTYIYTWEVKDLDSSEIIYDTEDSE